MKQRKRRSRSKGSRIARLRKELRYNVSPLFINTICLPGIRPDPERTKEMVREERQLRRELKSVRKQMADSYLGYWDDVNKERWTSRYTEELSNRRGGTLFSWDTWRAVFPELEGTQKWSDVEHSHRRMIAIFDEEIELAKQSFALAKGAHHLNKMVSSGCCVNKREFRRRYGF